MLRKLGAQIHDYNLKLTKAELLALNGEGTLEEVNDATDKLWSMIEKEAKRLGDTSSK